MSVYRLRGTLVRRPDRLLRVNLEPTLPAVPSVGPDSSRSF